MNETQNVKSTTRLLNNSGYPVSYLSIDSLGRKALNVLMSGQVTDDHINVLGIVIDRRYSPIKKPDGTYAPVEIPGSEEDSAVKKLRSSVAVLRTDGSILDQDSWVADEPHERFLDIVSPDVGVLIPPERVNPNQ